MLKKIAQGENRFCPSNKILDFSRLQPLRVNFIIRLFAPHMTNISHHPITLHSHTNTHTPPQSHTQTHTLSATITNTNTHSHTLTHTITITHTHTHSHTHSTTITHTQTHTHTQADNIIIDFSSALHFIFHSVLLFREKEFMTGTGKKKNASFFF